MILEWLFGLFEAALTGLLATFPTLPTFDASEFGAASGIFALFGYLDWFVPIWWAMGAAGLLAGGWVLLQAYRVLEWTLTKAHILGGSS